MDINLLELIGEQRLNLLQQRFFYATGFPNACLDHEGVLLTHAGDTEPLCMNLIRQNLMGLQQCQDFVNKLPQNDSAENSRVLRCHAGLFDARIPIWMEQEIIGYLVMGQVLDQPMNKDQAMNYALELAIDPDLYWETMQQVKIVPREKIEAAAQLLEFMGCEIATMASSNLKLIEAIEEKTNAENKQKQLNDDLIKTNKILEQERERFRLLVENTQDAIFVTDESGYFTIVNDQACRSTGYTEDELMQMHTGEIEIGHTPAEIAEIFDDLRQGKVHRAQGLHRKRDGSTFPVETMLCSYSTGGRLNLLGVARDITERKEAEKEKELLELELRQAQKLEAIGTLAGGIAHDFNNILSGILGYTELSIRLIEESNVKQQKDRLNKILRGGLRARDLVQQILQFSKKSDRTINLVKLSTIIEEALLLLRSSLPSTIEIKTDIDPDIVALVDPTEFHQIIMNLCTNAFHAMRSSGGMLTVNLTNIHTSRNSENVKVLMPKLQYIELSVEDNGQGIPAETLERIYEPYYTSKNLGEGTGLGLAVVHGLVKSSGGEISVKSTLNKGTCFKIYLPTTHVKSSSAVFSNEEKELPVGNERIVIVDDDENLLEMNCHILEDLGYKTQPFSNSSYALSYILNNQSQVDLVVSDMTMPKITGLDLFKQINKVAPDIPVILYSGYSDLVNKEEALSIGIKDYLQKPVSVKDLTVSIRKSLDESRRG